MASGIWEYAAAEISRGNIDFLNDTFKIQAVESGFTPVFDTAGGQFLDDIVGGDRLGDPTTLAGKAISDASVWDANDPTLLNVGAGGTAIAYVVYKDSGVESTSPLVMYGDSNDLVTDGNNVTVTFNATNGIFKLV